MTDHNYVAFVYNGGYSGSGGTGGNNPAFSETCDGNGFTTPETTNYNLPPSGAQFHEVDTLNGQIIYDHTGTTAYAGSGYFNTSETDGGGFPTKLPYTYSSTYDFSVDGVPINRVSYYLTCDENGQPAINIVNGAKD